MTNTLSRSRFSILDPCIRENSHKVEEGPPNGKRREGQPSPTGAGAPRASERPPIAVTTEGPVLRSVFSPTTQDDEHGVFTKDKNE